MGFHVLMLWKETTYLAFEINVGTEGPVDGAELDYSHLFHMEEIWF